MFRFREFCRSLLVSGASIFGDVESLLLRMLTPVSLLPNALPELFVQVSYSGKITLADRYGLMAALLGESLPEEERELIDRLLHAVYRRRLKVVNEFSSVLTLKASDLEAQIEALIFQCCA